MVIKICFLIYPIGKEGSDIRKRADQVYNHIVVETLRNLKFSRLEKFKDPLIKSLIAVPSRQNEFY
ncbi:MAG: hypothetical protein ACTSPV_10290 [Candidatus Hodarchaeales archaeon]